MYRLIQVRAVVADDGNLFGKTFDRSATLFQTRDLEATAPALRVAPGAAEAQVNLGALSTGYAIALFADYPVKVRLNGPSATQFTLRSNSTPPVNQGAPLPPQCVFVATMDVSSLYVEPIASATQTASVWLVVTGDPTNSYT